MKLLAFGLLMLAAAIAMLVFSDLNATTPFIGGVACTFLGVINLLTLPDRGSPAPASDTADAVNLVNDIDRHR